MSPPVVIAHRGASGYRPEHSRAAYELAIALGADAIEPDIVATRDGVLVLRHENEISGTTDVADRPEFADRRTTREVDGERMTGWFTEDFTWDELRTLRVRERLPELRQHSATFDGRMPILRLRDLLDLLDEAADRGRPVSLVAEVKHPTHFAAAGLPLGDLLADELRGWDDGGRVVVECFERGVLERMRGGTPGRYVYLHESRGAAADLTARFGSSAPSYAEQLSDAGLAESAGLVDGVSVDKSLLLGGAGGTRPTDLVDRAHAAGLAVFAWTLRPENRFLARGHRGEGEPGDWGDWRREFTTLLETGLDGVFLDHPDLGRELVDHPEPTRRAAGRHPHPGRTR